MLRFLIGFRSSAGAAVLLVGLIALLSGCATQPELSSDGLLLTPTKRVDAAYLRPGVDFTRYQQLSLEPCSVSFRSRWLAAQNATRRPLAHRVTQADMNAIRDELAQLCDTTLSAALASLEGWRLVDAAERDASTLLLAPRIIDLEVVAPDLNPVGVLRTFTAESGRMTLRLEGSDAHTGELLLRVMDTRRDPRATRFEWTNRITNRRDAQRTLSVWAADLRDGFTAAIDAKP